MVIEAPAVAIAHIIQIDRVCRFSTNSTTQLATGLLSSAWSAASFSWIDVCNSQSFAHDVDIGCFLCSLFGEFVLIVSSVCSASLNDVCDLLFVWCGAC